MRSQEIFRLLLGPLLSLAAATSALAAPGDLDTSFGGTGTVTTDIGPDDEARSMAVQADGKIVLAGTSCDDYCDFAVARYNANGTLDTSFGATGVVTTSIGNSHALAYSVAVQADGKIVAAGFSTRAAITDFTLVRYNVDGTLDSSFGGSGVVTTHVGGTITTVADQWFLESAHSVAIQQDGRIVAAGIAHSAYGPDYPLVFAVVRYNDDGTLDATFGGTGIVTTPHPSDPSAFNVGAYSLALQADAKIILAGFAEYAALNSSNFMLVRYNVDGTVDTTFGGTGTVTTSIISNSYCCEEAKSIAVQADGKIVVVGSFGFWSSPTAHASDVAVVRYNADGTLDTSFGAAGIVHTSVGTYDEGSSVALQSDGKIVVSGAATTLPNADFLVMRYDADGTLDTSFGNAGIVATSIHRYANAYAVAVQPDGRILAAGTTWTTFGRAFAVVRYQGATSEAPCDLDRLDPDPNGTNDIEEGGVHSDFYKVTCSGLPPTAGIPVVFRTLEGEAITEETDGDGIVEVSIDAATVGPAGSTFAASLETVNGHPVDDFHAIYVNVKPRHLSRGYQMGLGAGAGAGPGLKVNIGGDLGAGISIDDQADELDSLSGGAVTFSRRYTSEIGYDVVKWESKTKPGNFSPAATVDAKASIKLFSKDAFRLDDVWNSGWQQLALGGLVLQSAAVLGARSLGPLAEQIVDHVTSLIAQLDQYRSSEGVGIAAEVSGQAAGLLGTFFPAAEFVPAADLSATGGLEFGTTYLAELYWENGGIDELALALEMDAAIDIGLAANGFTSSDPAKAEVDETFNPTVGLGGGLSAKAVFTPNTTDLKRIELEISTVAPWSLDGSIAAKTPNVSVGGDESQSLSFVFQEDAAHEIVDRLHGIFLGALAHGAGTITMGPTRVVQDLADLFNIAQDLPYEFERKRTIGLKKDARIGLTTPVVGANINIGYVGTLSHVIKRGVGAGSLFVTERYPAEEFDQSDLPPSLTELVTQTIGGVIQEYVDTVLEVGEDVCDHGGWLVAPGSCAIIEFGDDLPDFLPLARASQAATTEPRFGVGGYHLFAPEGLIIVRGSHDSLTSANGTARLDVDDVGGRVALRYDASRVDPDWEPALRVHRWVAGANRWQAIGGSVDTATQTVTAPVDRFGLYTLAPVLPTGAIEWTIPASVLADQQIEVTGTVTSSDGRAAIDGTLVTVEALDLWQVPAMPAGVLSSPDADPATAGLQVPTTSGKFTVAYLAPSYPTDLSMKARSVHGDALGEARLLVRDVAVVAQIEMPLGTQFDLLQGTIRTLRSTATPAKYSLKGMLRYPVGRAPTCGASPFTLTLRSGNVVVASESVPFLPETQPGKQWKYKGQRRAAGLALISLRRKGVGYELNLRGTGNLSALHGADLAIEVGCGNDTAEGIASFTPKASANALLLKFKR